jgi:hypothetical protein
MEQLPPAHSMAQTAPRHRLAHSTRHSLTPPPQSPPRYPSTSASSARSAGLGVGAILWGFPPVFPQGVRSAGHSSTRYSSRYSPGYFPGFVPRVGVGIYIDCHITLLSFINSSFAFKKIKLYVLAHGCGMRFAACLATVYLMRCRLMAPDALSLCATSA